MFWLTSTWTHFSWCWDTSLPTKEPLQNCKIRVDTSRMGRTSWNKPSPSWSTGQTQISFCFTCCPTLWQCMGKRNSIWQVCPQQSHWYTNCEREGPQNCTYWSGGYSKLETIMVCVLQLCLPWSSDPKPVTSISGHGLWGPTYQNLQPLQMAKWLWWSIHRFQEPFGQ